MTENAQSNETNPEFAIQRIFVKDLSFETPNSPEIFTVEWDPESSLNLNSSVNKLDDNAYEITLTVTVTTKVGDQTAYLAEVQQGGIFHVNNFPEEQMGHMMGAYCPNILFPYAREVVSDLVTKGGFPQLLLTPVNFDALYAQHMQEQAAAGTEQEQTAH